MIKSTTSTIPQQRIKNILVPTDFSDASWQAAQFALRLASKHQSKLIFAHILEEAPINPAIIPDRYVKELQADRIRLIRQKLEAYEEYCDLKGHCALHKSIIMPGRAASMIIQMATNENIDLIVMGSAGASRLLESVSLEVIDKADCPVIFLPHRLEVSPFRDLVFLPRSTTQSAQAIGYLKAFCEANQLDLHIAPAQGLSEQNLRSFRLLGPESILSVRLAKDPAERLIQRRDLQQLIRNEHMPLFIIPSTKQ